MKLNRSFQKMFVMVTFLIIPGLVLLAADKADKKVHWPVIKKGAEVMRVQGVLRNMRDAKSIPLSQRLTPRKMKPVLNLDRGLPIIKKETRPDTAVQDFNRSSKTASMEPPRQLAVPIIDFAGLDFQNWGAGWPPDPTGDVGISHYVQAVNIAFGIYRKSDGVREFATEFDDFFSLPGTPCDSNNHGDPIVMFDAYAQRWFILDFAWYSNHSTGSWFSIAVSQTSNPLGSWYQYALQADTTRMNDYPKVGIWHDAIYITANMFGFNSPYPFYGVKVWALKKSDLYSGTVRQWVPGLVDPACQCQRSDAAAGLRAQLYDCHGCG